MSSMNRRSFLRTLGLSGAALAVSGHAAHAQGATSKPNIIFIMVDDMGYADLGCYGSKTIQTPRIDKMAAEGMRFTQVYSGCTVCAPARSTLLTGTHMGHTSVRGNTGGIPLLATDVTVAEVLKKADYTCGGFGKWGVGDIDTEGVPEKNGFDTFYGYYHQIHAHDYYPDYLIRNGKKEMLPGNAGKKRKQYTHHLIFDEMMQFIRDNKDQSFFCYAPWTPPHGKYQIPRDEPALAQYKDKGWPKNETIVAAMDTMIDRQVGEIIDLLKELGLDDNTIIFFCSDNGASERFDQVHQSSGPLRGKKRDMYEGGLRVPMIVRWPGKIKAGSESDLQWYFPDVLPTLADLAGVSGEVPACVDGLSVVPTLTGKGDQPAHECLYWEWPRYEWSKKRYAPNGVQQAVRSGDWKMLRYRQDQPWQLYDLAKDIGERHDVAAEHPDVVQRLDAWVTKNRTEMRPQIEPAMPEGKMFR